MAKGKKKAARLKARQNEYKPAMPNSGQKCHMPGSQSGRK